MARKLTKMVRVESHQFNRIIYRIERIHGQISVDSRGVYRMSVKGRIRIVGSNHLGYFLNANLLGDINETIN